MNVKLWLAKAKAEGMRMNILLAIDRRDMHVLAAEHLGAQIQHQQDELRKVNTRIAMLETPSKLIERST